MADTTVKASRRSGPDLAWARSVRAAAKMGKMNGAACLPGVLVFTFGREGRASSHEGCRAAHSRALSVGGRWRSLYLRVSPRGHAMGCAWGMLSCHGPHGTNG